MQQTTSQVGALQSHSVIPFLIVDILDIVTILYQDT